MSGQDNVARALALQGLSLSPVVGTGKGVSAKIRRSPLLTALFDADFAGQKAFVGKPLQSALTVSRSGNATLIDGAGQPQFVPSNIPRFTCDEVTFSPAGLLVEESSANVATGTQGGSGGAVGTTINLSSPGGSLPTGWNNGNSIVGGMSMDIIAKPTGWNSKWSFRLYGTPTATGGFILSFNATTTVVATQGDVFTGRLQLRIAAGSVPGSGNAQLTGLERNASGTFVAQTVKTIFPQTDILTEHEITYTIGNAGSARTSFGFGFSLTSGTPVDVTFELQSIQHEKKAYATSYFPNDTAANPLYTGARNADDITLADASTFLAGNNWTVVVGGRSARNIGNATLWQADDGTSSNRVTLRLANYVAYLTSVVGGVSTDTRLGYWLPWTTGVVALAYNGTSIRASYNGKAVKAVAAAALPNLNRIVLGNGAAGYWNSYLDRLSILQGVASDQDLIDLAIPSGLFDDFERANGAIGVPPTLQAYKQIPTSISATVALQTITNGKLITADSGSTKTNAYTGVDMGVAPTTMGIGVVFENGNTGGAPTLISQPQGNDLITQIITQSLHMGFSDGSLYWGVFANNVLTQLFPLAVSPPIPRDGVTVAFFVLKIVGNSVYIRIPNGSVERRVDPTIGASKGRYCTFETYFDSGKSSQTYVAVRFDTQ